jgi:hypothetical protein
LTAKSIAITVVKIYFPASILGTFAINDNWIEQRELAVSKCIGLKANKNCKHRSKRIVYTRVLLPNSMCSD